MKQWFECKVRYDKTMENGLLKKVTESYLVDAISFTEAEARIIQEVTPFISGEFSIADIKRSNIAEIFFKEGGDRYYKCKVVFIHIDETTAKEKKTASYILAQASDFKEALSNLLNGMRETLADYTIESITETILLDVYLYKEPEVKDNETMVIERFVSSLPDGQKTTITVGNKVVEVDKTGVKTIVKPLENNNSDDA